MGKAKSKKIFFWLIVIFFICLAFSEMFLNRNISSIIKFMKLEHYENRADLLMFISIIVTSIISYNVYNLSKRIDEQNNIEKLRNKYESTCIVYDYLNEIILYTKKVVFKEKEDYNTLDYNKDFMKHVYNISRDVFNEQDIELIRKIDRSIRNYFNRNISDVGEKLAIKWVYKNLFDMSIDIEQIEKFNNIVDVDLLLSSHLVLILSKLRKKQGYEYCKKINYEKFVLEINDNKNILVKKRYKDDCYIENGSGILEIYEPIFYVNDKSFYRNGGMVYKGEIKKYLPNGNGTYYYHMSDVSKNIFVNSDDLVDKTAERIKKILQNENIPTRTNLTVNGQFKDGKIINGLIIFEEEKYKQIEVKENEYNMI